MYEQQILRILLDVGARGISVKKLAKHVYNHYCTLFSQPDFADVHRAVQQYLAAHSRSPHAIVERVSHGYYRLNTDNSPAAHQLMLDFSDDAAVDDDVQDVKPAVDLSLSLFD